METRSSQLLDVAKLRVGLKPQGLNLEPLFQEVEGQLSPLIHSKGQSLTVDLPNSLPQVEGGEAPLPSPCL